MKTDCFTVRATYNVLAFTTNLHCSSGEDQAYHHCATPATFKHIPLCFKNSLMLFTEHCSEQLGVNEKGSLQIQAA